jgi:serine/threonine-protein kinase HipA
MSDSNLSEHLPPDTLHLWWLGQPGQPRHVGDLHLVRALKGVSLRYANSWLQTGFALSEDLPLLDTVFLPHDKETAAGAVDDARPDRWGERLIRLLDRPPRLSVLDFLFYAGDERFGALGVSTSATRYQPRRMGPLPQLADAQAIATLVGSVIAGEAVPENQHRLIAPGVTLGGARPKALLEMDGAQWVLKFGEPGDTVDTPLVEHATLTLAAQADIGVATTRPVALQHGHAVAVQRFDRVGGQRKHALSANVALKAAGEALGYPELAQLLRRRGPPQHRACAAQMRELFRRMVFNILMDNTDDHEKNHALLATHLPTDGTLTLAPAFDVLPSGQALGYQQMRVGRDGAEATLGNALSECAQFGLTQTQAKDEVRTVCAVVAGWQRHFQACGVPPADVATLAQQIDRPFLLKQRQAVG